MSGHNSERGSSEDSNISNTVTEAEAIEARAFASNLRLDAYERSMEASLLELEAARATILASQARIRADQMAFDCFDAEREAARLVEQANYVPEEREEREEQNFRVVVDAGIWAVDAARAIADILHRTEVADRTRLTRPHGLEGNEDLRLQAEAADRTRMSGQPGGHDPEASITDQYTRTFTDNLADDMLRRAAEMARRNDGRVSHELSRGEREEQSNLIQAISQISDLWRDFRLLPAVQELELPEGPKAFANIEEVHEFVNGLPRPSLDELEEDDRRCHICLEPFVTDSPAEDTAQSDLIDEEKPEIPLRTRCGHITGSRCLLTWISPLINSTKAECPHCRTQLRDAGSAGEEQHLVQE